MVRLLKVVLAFVFKILLWWIKLADEKIMKPKSLGSSFFVGDVVFLPILTPLLSRHVIVMFKGNFERIAFTLKSVFPLVESFNLITSRNKIDVYVALRSYGLTLINCLPSAIGFTKSLATNPKSSSVVYAMINAAEFHFPRLVKILGEN